MAARTSEEEQKRRRRKRLIQGLVLGAAAVGVPALANAVISRRNRKLPPAMWGRSHRYACLATGEGPDDLTSRCFQERNRRKLILMSHMWAFALRRSAFEAIEGILEGYWRRLTGDDQNIARAE